MAHIHFFSFENFGHEHEKHESYLRNGKSWGEVRDSDDDEYLHLGSHLSFFLNTYIC